LSRRSLTARGGLAPSVSAVHPRTRTARTARAAGARNASACRAGNLAPGLATAQAGAGQRPAREVPSAESEPSDRSRAAVPAHRSTSLARAGSNGSIPFSSARLPSSFSRGASLAIREAA
jgi:hypothetical protein